MGRELVGILFAFVFALLLPFAAAIDATTTASGTSGGSGVATSVIYTHVGGEFKFTEYSNPSTGYNWVVLVDDQKVVAYNGYKEVDCNAQTTSADGTITAVSVGGGCNYAFYFKAIAEGNATIGMKYMRSWDSGSVVKVKQVAVVVSAASPTPSVSATLTPTPVADCRAYWWFDNSHSYCQQARFCGAYMYLGLRTFQNQTDCMAALPNASKACAGGDVASSYCCADGVLCKKVCRNGAFTEEKAESANCKKAVATPTPVVTPVPKPTTTPASIVEIRMQKGWNLFSVPATYASMYKTSCTRERAYYYNAASGQYVSSSLKSINSPKAHWFYSAEECTVAFSQKAAYAKENYKEELKAGWNMVPAPVGEMIKASKCEPATGTNGTIDKCTTYATYAPVKLSDYKGTCNIVAAYSFDTAANSWVKADALEAKKGYFVKVSAACKMYAPDETSSIPALPE